MGFGSPGFWSWGILGYWGFCSFNQFVFALTCESPFEDIFVHSVSAHIVDSEFLPFHARRNAEEAVHRRC